MDNSTHQAFIKQYEDCEKKIFNYLMHRLNFNRELCEDLLMDIALKAYEKFHYFNAKKGSFKGWIFKITHNHLINHWRDKKQTHSLEDIEENGRTLATVEIEDLAEAHFNEKSIRSTLGCLSPASQEVLSLHYLSDLSFKEIAKITGKKQSTIRANLSRALAQFKLTYQKLYAKEH